MKHFINILVILILTGFAVGIAYLAYNSPNSQNSWGFLFLPLIALMWFWGEKLYRDYE